MGVRPHLHRRRLPGGLLADPPRREKGERGRLPQGDGRLLREPWRHDYPCDDRQWLLLSLQGLPLCLPRSRPQAHPDQALYAQDQRQSRALHPDRSARMGLRSGLPHLGPPRRCVADLATPIQLAPAAQQSKSKSAHQPPRSDRGQPVEAPQLGMEHGTPRVSRDTVAGGDRSWRAAFVYPAEDLFRATAARMSALKASSSTSSPSRKSIARPALPSRLELNRPEGSLSEAPLANVSFTTLLYVS